ncbi:hypothetical protein ACL9RL_00225 [Plantibacter sp. Mn2098]|uniref:hypothetical protein n=1 Tax=Plantibacter sp. Mn2098 TaxID=3395266 RepID=UPI003BB9AD4F
MTQRTCAATGLVLFDGPVVAHRVARESYGPLRPLMRPDEDARDAWSRFDTPGRTIYAAADSSTAYAEALAWARQDIANERRELSKTAAHFGLSIEDLWADIWDEWHANESMAPGWLPAVWRGGRRRYEVRFGRGPWVDIDHSETLRVISGVLREELETRWGVCGGLTLADVKSERRGVTTRIAEWLRETVTLDDGSQPLGVRFSSKLGRFGDGEGTCWAYWMRQSDAGLQETGVTADSGSDIEADDPAFGAALRLHGIQSR